MTTQEEIEREYKIMGQLLARGDGLQFVYDVTEHAQEGRRALEAAKLAVDDQRRKIVTLMGLS